MYFINKRSRFKNADCINKLSYKPEVNTQCLFLLKNESKVR